MLPERTLMKKIAGGYEIPWPEPLTDCGFVMAKDYRMNGFPKTAAGKPWYDIPDDDYVSWLADYLPANLPPLNVEQHRLSLHLDSYTRFSGFWIGDRAGWYESEAVIRPFHTFPENFDLTCNFAAVKTGAGGYAYKEYVEWAQEVLDQGERVMTPEEFILEDFGWNLVLSEGKQQFTGCWPGFVQLDGVSIILGLNSHRDEPFDAGWRVYPAMLLQKMADKSVRMKAIKDFYFAWHDQIK